MLKVMADNDINIPSIDDANHYLALGNMTKHYIIYGIGDGFKVSTTGLKATLGTGQGSCYGRTVVNDGTETVTTNLPATSTFYLVLNVNLTRPSGQEIKFMTKSILTQEDLSNGGFEYDIPLERITTSATTVTSREKLYKFKSNYAELGNDSKGEPFTRFERLHLEITFTNQQNINESYTLASLGIGNAKEFWIDQSLSYYNYGGVASVNRYSSANSLSNVYIDGTPQLRLIFKEVIPIAKIVYHITINYRL